MAHRKRTVQLHFMVTEHERELIRQKMEQLGTNNLGVYLRKMAIDGYIVKLELPELRELLSLLRRTSNNITRWPAGCIRPGMFMTRIWRIFSKNKRNFGPG